MIDKSINIIACYRADSAVHCKLGYFEMFSKYFSKIGFGTKLLGIEAMWMCGVQGSFEKRTKRLIIFLNFLKIIEKLSTSDSDSTVNQGMIDYVDATRRTMR